MRKRIEEGPVFDQIRQKLGVSGDLPGREILAAYGILENPDRMKDFFGLSEVTRETQVQLVRDLFDVPSGYGIEKFPAGGLYRCRQGVRMETTLGQAFPKEGKPFSADAFAAFGFETPSVPYFDNHSFVLQVLVMADGASMFVKEEDWPREVVDICSFDLREGSYCLPDVLWRTMFERLFNNSMASPYQDLVTRAIFDAGEKFERLKDSLASRFRNYPQYKPVDLAREVLDYINQETGSFLKKVFQDFGLETYELYPSGVAGVLVSAKPVYHPQLDFRKRSELDGLGGFASCGDVSITVGGKLVNDSTRVDYHDELIDTLLGRDSASVVRKVGHYRAKDVGNLQGFPVVVESGSFSSIDPRFVLYTDGLKIDEETAAKTFVAGSGSASYYQEKDPAAFLIFRDPMLAVLLRRRQNRRREEADDGAYLLFNPVTEVNSYTPLIFQGR